MCSYVAVVVCVLRSVYTHATMDVQTQACVNTASLRYNLSVMRMSISDILFLKTCR